MEHVRITQLPRTIDLTTVRVEIIFRLPPDTKNLLIFLGVLLALTDTLGVVYKLPSRIDGESLRLALVSLSKPDTPSDWTGAWRRLGSRCFRITIIVCDACFLHVLRKRRNPNSCSGLSSC